MENIRIKTIGRLVFITVILVLLVSSVHLGKNPSNDPYPTQENSWETKSLIDLVLITSPSGKSTDEFITITVPEDLSEEFDVSLWQLRTSAGVVATLPKASPLPLQGKINSESPIKVSGGETLIVSSGISPLGVSFRENRCIGFFNQFQKFTPPLAESCPRALEIISQSIFDTLDEECQSYIEAMPLCKIQYTDFPRSLSKECRRTITEYVHYNMCVDRFATAPEFYLNSWRIFLENDTPIWNAVSMFNPLNLETKSGTTLARFFPAPFEK